MQNVARFFFGTLLFFTGLAMLGLDIHIAFTTRQFAHVTNLALAIFVLLVSLTLMFWQWLQPLFASLVDGIRAWRAKP